MPSRMIASALALLAFTAAIVAGLIADNPASTTLGRALLAMAVCFVVGLAIGAVAQRAVREHIDHHKSAHPLQSEGRSEDGRPGDAAAGEMAGDRTMRTSGDAPAGAVGAASPTRMDGPPATASGASGGGGGRAA